MTYTEMREKDIKLTKIQRRLERDLRTAKQLVREVRLEYAARMWGVEVGALVINKRDNSLSYNCLFVVSRLDADNTPLFHKRLKKPWAYGRKVINGDPNNTEKDQVALFSDYRVYEPETD